MIKYKDVSSESVGGRGEGESHPRLYKPWSIYFYLENLLLITADIYRHGAGILVR
jgi:hypothetical protein